MSTAVDQPMRARKMTGLPQHRCQCGSNFFTIAEYKLHRLQEGPCQFRYGHPMTIESPMASLSPAHYPEPDSWVEGDEPAQQNLNTMMTVVTPGLLPVSNLKYRYTNR